MALTEFLSLEKFQKRKILSGKAISVYLHELKMLLDQAMPGLAAKAKQQLLLCTSILIWPPSISESTTTCYWRYQSFRPSSGAC